MLLSTSGSILHGAFSRQSVFGSLVYREAGYGGFVVEANWVSPLKRLPHELGIAAEAAPTGAGARLMAWGRLLLSACFCFMFFLARLAGYIDVCIGECITGEQGVELVLQP